jgi:hypothetical protein
MTNVIDLAAHRDRNRTTSEGTWTRPESALLLGHFGKLSTEGVAVDFAFGRSDDGDPLFAIFGTEDALVCVARLDVGEGPRYVMLDQDGVALARGCDLKSMLTAHLAGRPARMPRFVNSLTKVAAAMLTYYLGSQFVPGLNDALPSPGELMMRMIDAIPYLITAGAA